MNSRHRKIANKISGFQQRWNFYYNDERKILEFKKRCLNSFAKILGFKFITDKYPEGEFCYIIGIHEPKNIFNIGLNTNFKFNPQDSIAYKTLAETEDLIEFLFIIESITLIESLPNELIEKFIDEIIDNVQITNLNINVKKDENEIIFYPKGAKLLDEKLINDNLDWLREYPQTHKLFKNLLNKIEKHDDARNIIDDLRLSLETFLKSKLNNSKSLENQISELGQYLKNKETNSEIMNLFVKLIDYYSKFQNEKIKHSDLAKKEEVEFVMYLTATFIRFLITT